MEPEQMEPRQNAEPSSSEETTDAKETYAERLRLAQDAQRTSVRRAILVSTVDSVVHGVVVVLATSFLFKLFQVGDLTWQSKPSKQCC